MPRALGGAGAEPAPEGVGLPVGEQVDRPPGPDVDQDGAVDAAAAESEVIDLPARQPLDYRESPHHARRTCQ
jgi:hypothetical protein